MTIERLYYSRENRIAQLNSEDARVQYDSVDYDVRVIEEAIDGFDKFSEDLSDAVEEYLNILQGPVNEDTASQMGYARRELIEKWAFAQATPSKLAWVMRIDADEAYQRLIESLKTDKALDMSGL